MVYWSVFLLLIMASSSMLFSTKRFIYASFIFMAMCLILTSMSNNTGQDFQTYISMWEAMKNLSTSSKFDYYYSNIEVGYKYFIYIVSHFSSSNEFFIFVNAFFSLGLTFVGLYSLSDDMEFNYLFSILVLFSCFLIPYNFNAMRQAITMGFFVFSIKDSLDSKMLHVFLLSFFSFLMHSTGILMLLSYFVISLSFNQMKFSMYLVLLGVVTHFLGLTNIMFQFSGSDKFTVFSDKWGNGSLSGIVLRMSLFLFMVIMSYSLKFSRYFLDLMLIYSLGLFFYFSFYDAGMLASSLNMFFSFLEIMILPAMVMSLSGMTRVLSFVFILLLCSLQLYLSSSSPANYYTVFDTYDLFWFGV